MKLNLRAALKSILRFGKSQDEDSDAPVSMVLLLRSPHFLTIDQLRSAGERAFETPFSDRKDSKYCVVEAGLFTMMKAGPHLLTFLKHKKPYGDGEFPSDFAESLPQASQRQAWAEHTAWTAVNYAKGGADPEREYGVLGKLCAEMLDDNCVGVYVPGEQSLIPNDGSLGEELKRMGE